jgi:hypothetical protein
MLYLDQPIGPINGLIIYRDHADKSQFYFVPERPRLAKNDGVPEFVFLKYRRDITDNPDFDPEAKQALGGGFLAFTVDLGVDDDQLGEIKRELARFADGGEVKLAPVQFRKGSVRLSIAKDTAEAPGAPPDQPKGMSFFEEIYGATTPSLFGFNRATFGVVLPQEGATMVEAALRSGISPIGVLYNLELLGLRPAFNVKITAEYHRIYDHLEAQFGARGQIYAVALGVDIAAAFQKLRDDGAIKVEVMQFTDDDNLRKQSDAAFDWFKTQLVNDFFKSSLNPPGFMSQSNGGGGLLGQLQSLLGNLGGTQTTSPQPQRGNPTNAAPTTDAPPTDRDSGVTSTSEANRAAAGNAAASGGGGTGGLSPFQVAFSLKYYHQEELKTREFEYSMQAAEAREAAPQGMFSTVVAGLDLDRAIKEVSLDDDFFRRLVATVRMGGDLAASGVSMVAVNMEYPGTRGPAEEPATVDGFVFTPDQLAAHTFNSWLNDKKDLTYRYQMDIHFKPDSPWAGKDAHITTPWEVSRARQLTLDPLDHVGLFDLELSLGSVDASQIDQVQVELAYNDPANQFEAHRTFVLRPGQAGASWKLRLSDPDLRAYQYRTTYFFKDGVRYESDWQTSEDPSLVINDPFQGSIKLRLVPVLDPAALIEADVDLVYHEAATGYQRRIQTVFSGSPLASQPIVIPTLAKEPGGYAYDVTVIRMDGSVFESGTIAAEADRNALPISDGAGATHRIKVRLPGANLAALNLAAIKVNLVGPGESPDTAEAVFTPSQTADQTLALVQPDAGGPFVYRYSVTGYSNQGLPIPGDSGESADLNLFVRMPTA